VAEFALREQTIVPISHLPSLFPGEAFTLRRMSLGKSMAIVVAAGAGRRMGFDKIVAPLAGRPVLCWSLEAFQECEDITSGVLVCAAGRIEEFRRLAEPFSKFRTIVAGGDERADSVINGLDALEAMSPDIVAVHDAARPLVTPGLISAVVGAASERGAAVAAEPVGDTLHRAGGSHNLTETVPRHNLWAMQTPQAARYSVLREALASARATKHGVTDEVSALIARGVSPHAVSHTGLNFKVTWPRDLELAELILEKRRQ